MILNLCNQRGILADITRAFHISSKAMEKAKVELTFKQKKESRTSSQKEIKYL